MKALNFSDPKLDEILSRLIPEFNPTKIFLFGSRAIGKARVDSDYDVFLVIEKSNLHSIERMQKAVRLLSGVNVKVDVFIYTQEEFDDWKDEFSSIPHTVTTEGLELQVG
jgi:predicted nucleotidyltransferase